MNIELFITILVLLLVGIIFFKTMRKILSILLCVVIIYFFYYTMFTSEGAVYFALLRKTVDPKVYKLEIKEENGEYIVDEVETKDGKKITTIKCEKYGPVLFCDEFR